MMYNKRKEVISIKRKDITFVFSFILFLLLGLGLFFYIEGKILVAGVALVSSLVLFVITLIYSLKSKDCLNDSLDENNKITPINKDEMVSVNNDNEHNKLIIKEIKITSVQESIEINDITSPKLNLIVDYITLKMSQIHFENLNSLIDQLEQASMVKDNQAFSNNLNSEDKVYAKLFPKLPIVNVIKDKRVGYKIFGGIDVQSIYELGQINEIDLPYVKEIYPKTKNLVATIEGGKLKDFQTKPPSQKFLPYRVKIKFYQ